MSRTPPGRLTPPRAGAGRRGRRCDTRRSPGHCLAGAVAGRRTLHCQRAMCPDCLDPALADELRWFIRDHGADPRAPALARRLLPLPPRGRAARDEALAALAACFKGSVAQKARAVRAYACAHEEVEWRWGRASMSSEKLQLLVAALYAGDGRLPRSASALRKIIVAGLRSRTVYNVHDRDAPERPAGNSRQAGLRRLQLVAETDP